MVIILLLRAIDVSFRLLRSNHVAFGVVECVHLSNFPALSFSFFFPSFSLSLSLPSLPPAKIKCSCTGIVREKERERGRGVGDIGNQAARKSFHF